MTSLLKRIAAPANTGAPLTPLLEAHLDMVGGGRRVCSHTSSGCGPNHNSTTVCTEQT